MKEYFIMVALVCLIVYQFAKISHLQDKVDHNVNIVAGRKLIEGNNDRADPIEYDPMTVPCVTRSQKIRGVAITTFLGAPKWFQNRYSMMVGQVLSILPTDWRVQIFYNPKKRMAMQAIAHPGIKRLIAAGKVHLTAIPDELCKLKQKEIMVHPWLWENVLADDVLTFGGTSVLCANSPLDISRFLGKFDYIGAPWGDHQGNGGSGAISLRNRTKVLQIINEKIIADPKAAGKREDVVLVQHMLADKGSRVASVQDTHEFAMSSINKMVDDAGEPLVGYQPMGASGILGHLPDPARQKYIDFCPEMKMFYPSLHSPHCFGAEPNTLECLKYLCLHGGLKCGKTDQSMLKWFDPKSKKEIIVTVKTVVH
jgi:hypothetical protein